MLNFINTPRAGRILLHFIGGFYVFLTLLTLVIFLLSLRLAQIFTPCGATSSGVRTGFVASRAARAGIPGVFCF
jgi:hypothetical protein